MQDVAAYLRHIELQINIAASPAPTYPTQLYRMQQHINLLDTWYPQLKTVVITLIIANKFGPKPILRARGFSGQLTNLVDEVIRLTKKMTELKCKETILRIGERVEDKILWGRSVPVQDMKHFDRRRMVTEVVMGPWGKWRVDDRD